MLADGVVEDLPVHGNTIELDLLGVEDELAHHHRLVLGRVARGRQEFLYKNIDKKNNVTEKRRRTKEHNTTQRSEAVYISEQE